MPTMLVTKRSVAQKERYRAAQKGFGWREVEPDDKRAARQAEGREFLDFKRIGGPCDSCGRGMVFWYRKTDGGRSDVWQHAEQARPKWFIRMALSRLVPLCDDCAATYKPVGKAPSKKSINENRAGFFKARAMKEKDPTKAGRWWSLHYRYAEAARKEKEREIPE